MVRDRFVSGHWDCTLRRHLDSVPPDTPIRNIVDQCRVWESHSDTHVGYRRLPTVTDNNRGLSTISGGLPGVAETPQIEPIVQVAMFSALPEELIVLEVVPQSILDQTVNCARRNDLAGRVAVDATLLAVLAGDAAVSVTSPSYLLEEFLLM